jgi:hypothetical protein
MQCSAHRVELFFGSKSGGTLKMDRARIVELSLWGCWLVASLGVAMPAAAHDCRVKNGYLRGHYEGDCEEKNEIAQGHGVATGADRYVGMFVQGYPEGKGVYTWENGARLDGIFKAGKADGPGVYISARGARYESRFENGKLIGAKREDCPVTQGPLEC